MENDIQITDSTREIIEAYLERKHAKRKTKIHINVQEEEGIEYIRHKQGQETRDLKNEIDDILNQFEQLYMRTIELQNTNKYMMYKGLRNSYLNRIDRHFDIIISNFKKLKQDI